MADRIHSIVYVQDAASDPTRPHHVSHPSQSAMPTRRSNYNWSRRHGAAQQWSLVVSWTEYFLLVWI